MFRLLKKSLSNVFHLNSIIREEVLRSQLETSILSKVDSHVKNLDVVVSLTTYSKRIYDVHIVIESLFRQTIQPKLVVLWLDENEFSDVTLPEVLVLLKRKRNLEIKYCKNIKSYKKLIPTLTNEKYNTLPIITVDDDVIYPIYFIEKLIKSHYAYPEDVICYRAHKMKIGKYGEIGPYSDWEHNVNGGSVGFDICPTGVGGVLYPVGCFDGLVLNEDIYLSCAPRADDLWFKVMTAKNNIKSRVIDCGRFDSDFTIIKSTQDIALYSSNINENDKQMKAIVERLSFKLPNYTEST